MSGPKGKHENIPLKIVRDNEGILKAKHCIQVFLQCDKCF